jgi:Uma2 family endonuclease
MAAQTLPLSIEEFHRLYDEAKPAYEYWNGAAIQKPRPTVLHGIVQFLIMSLLKQAGWRVASEVRLKVTKDAEPVPDVIAVRGKFKGSYPETAPELCVEIMSPRDTVIRTFEKARRYIDWGTEAVWIVDPEKRTAWSLVRDTGGDPIWIAPNGTLRAGETEIELSTLFSEVDDQIEAGEPQD